MTVAEIFFSERIFVLSGFANRDAKGTDENISFMC